MWWFLTLAGVASAAWTPPVDGEVVRRFEFAPSAPYAAGRHRGVDLAARAGATVVAPCSGTVTFAGRTPRHGRGVTIACGTHAATVLELATTRVVRGRRATRGMPIGTAGARPVHLGARHRGRRHGYVDPLALLARTPTPPPTLAPPPRAPRPAPPAHPRPAPVRPTPTAAPRTTPLVAWLGLALLATALPTGALLHRRRRTARAREEATA